MRFFIGFTTTSRDSEACSPHVCSRWKNLRVPRIPTITRLAQSFPFACGFDPCPQRVCCIYNEWISQRMNLPATPVTLLFATMASRSFHEWPARIDDVKKSCAISAYWTMQVQHVFLPDMSTLGVQVAYISVAHSKFATFWCLSEFPHDMCPKGRPKNWIISLAKLGAKCHGFCHVYRGQVAEYLPWAALPRMHQTCTRWWMICWIFSFQIWPMCLGWRATVQFVWFSLITINIYKSYSRI